MRDQLVIPSNMDLSPWAKRTIYKLVDGNMFDVKKEEFPELNLKEIVGKRHGCMGFIKFNGVLMGIDVWDGPNPTCVLADWFNSSKFYSQTKIIFKIQHRPSSPNKNLIQFTQDTGIPVTNWTMFHSKTFPLEYFEWDKNKDYKYLTYISGKRRQEWLDCYRDSEEVATFDNTEYEKVRKNRPKLVTEGFLDIMQECKWGLSLKGKRIGNMDCKNRREVEFSSAKMPLALNYIPEYPFPFKKDKHYVYIEKPEDVMKLKDIDPVPYHEASAETYRKYFSAEGSSRVFLELIEGLT